MGLLAGKIVCITGSSRGIGRACALGSAKHGATGLVLHYLGDQESKAELLSLKEEIEVAPGVVHGARTAEWPRRCRGPRNCATGYLATPMSPYSQTFFGNPGL